MHLIKGCRQLFLKLNSRGINFSSYLKIWGASKVPLCLRPCVSRRQQSCSQHKDSFLIFQTRGPDTITEDRHSTSLVMYVIIHHNDDQRTMPPKYDVGGRPEQHCGPEAADMAVVLSVQVFNEFSNVALPAS